MKRLADGVREQLLREEELLVNVRFGKVQLYNIMKPT